MLLRTSPSIPYANAKLLTCSSSAGLPFATAAPVADKCLHASECMQLTSSRQECAMAGSLHPCLQCLRLECADSREIAEAAAPGSGIVASTILALGLAWSNVEAPEAQASFELPYSVSSSTLLPWWKVHTGSLWSPVAPCLCLIIVRQPWACMH